MTGLPRRIKLDRYSPSFPFCRVKSPPSVLTRPLPPPPPPKLHRGRMLRFPRLRTRSCRRILRPPGKPNHRHNQRHRLRLSRQHRYTHHRRRRPSNLHHAHRLRHPSCRPTLTLSESLSNLTTGTRCRSQTTRPCPSSHFRLSTTRHTSPHTMHPDCNSLSSRLASEESTPARMSDQERRAANRLTSLSMRMMGYFIELCFLCFSLFSSFFLFSQKEQKYVNKVDFYDVLVTKDPR